MAGLSAAGLLAHVAVQGLLDRPNEIVVATIPDVLALWREPSDAQSWAFGLISAPTFALLATLLRRRAAHYSPPMSVRWMWRLVALSAVLVTAGVGVGAVFGRDEVAVATPFGVSWLKDGKPREYWSWGAATSIAAACVKGEKPDSFALNYDVAFPTGREANLARPEDKIADLVPRLAVLDQRLRTSGVPRFVSVEPGCLEHVGQPLPPAERATLQGVVGR